MVPGRICESESWQAGRLEVATSGCQADFGISYDQNPADWNSSQSYNISFMIPWIAEINATGGLVQLASPLTPSSWEAGVVSTANEVNISLNQTLNVTSASGNWTANDTWAGTGPQWSVNQSVVGTAVFTVTFHLLNVTSNESANQTGNASYSVKFDIGVVHWPWASSDDRLGVGFEALGAADSHYVYNSSSQNLSEMWNSDNQSFVSLVFGPAATAYSPSGQPSPVSVETQAEIFTAATPGREAVALLSFDGVPGDYWNLAYDPWVEFVPGLMVSIPSRSPASTSLILDGVVAGALTVSVVAVVVTVRGRRLRREGNELVDGINRIISDDRPPPKGS